MSPMTTSRLLAGALAALGASTVTVLLDGAAPAYLAVLAGALAVTSLALAGRLWGRRCVCARVSASLLGAGVLAGQVLGASVGGPAGEGSPWRPSSVGIAALAALVLVLIAVDARVARVPDAARRPYAL